MGSALLSTLLLNGPSRIVSISDVTRMCEDGLGAWERECCMIVANEADESVVRAKENLEKASMTVRIFATE